MLPQLAAKGSEAQIPEQEQKETSVQNQQTNKKLNKEEVLSKLLPVISMLGKIKQQSGMKGLMSQPDATKERRDNNEIQ